mgnify:CR=1 FL=1
MIQNNNLNLLNDIEIVKRDKEIISKMDWKIVRCKKG